MNRRRSWVVALCTVAMLLNAVSLLSVLRWHGRLELSPAQQVALEAHFNRLALPERLALNAGVAVVGSRHVAAGTAWPAAHEFDLGYVLRFAAAFWLLAFAILIAARGKPTQDSMLLSALLLVQGAETAFARLVLPWPLPTALLEGLGGGLLWLGLYVMLALYAARAAKSRACRIAAIVTCLLALPCDIPVEMYKLGIVPQTAWADWIDALPIIPCLAGGIFAALALKGAERQRIAWVFVSYALFWLGWIAVLVAASLGWWTIMPYLNKIENAALFVVPLGLTYAALRRRLFDLGFVLNRAAVFAGVSAIVVGAFVLSEWALGTWFEHTSHEASLAINAALALLLGFSLRFVHHRVDRVVDTVFFRKRHEDEEALRNFAHEAPYVTDPSTLISRTIAIIELRTGADFATVVLCDALGPVDENDPALVALRAWHKPLDLHGVDTALRGEVAYPMVARGQLMGALVLGAKRSGEAYAPDESAAVGEIARSVASSLEVLETKQGQNVNQAMLAMLTSIQQTLLQMKIGAAPDGEIGT